MGEKITLVRMGDFWEAFDADADILADALKIVVATRNGRRMAGVPGHALHGYIAQLAEQHITVTLAQYGKGATVWDKITRRVATVHDVEAHAGTGPDSLYLIGPVPKHDGFPIAPGSVDRSWRHEVELGRMSQTLWDSLSPRERATGADNSHLNAALIPFIGRKVTVLPKRKFGASTFRVGKSMGWRPVLLAMRGRAVGSSDTIGADEVFTSISEAE